MKTPRLVQNFKGRRVVIFSSAGRSLEILDSTLRRLGLLPEVFASDPGKMLELPSDLRPHQDVVLIDGDQILPVNWPECYDLPVGMPPCPTIGLVGTEAPSRLKAMMQLGALAFLPKPIYAGSVFSALYLAVNEFNRVEALNASVAGLMERRRKRIHVIKAVAMLMRHRGLNEDAAYDFLRKESMRARVSIEDHCWILMQTASEGDENRNATPKRCRAH
ncbi:hypothetical protein JT55_16590 [Rhodovulum sp. NI22]|nr:hypothetical protein JT55_16590 [Rhodovulum sp. NI22]